MSGRRLLPALLLALSAGSGAHEGHVHAEAPPPSPRTPVAAAAAVVPSFVGWPARVVSDARRTVTMAAPEAGVLLAPASGFRRAGQRVRAGEVLGRLRPATPQLARRGIEGKLADARRDTLLGSLQIDRYGIAEAPRFDVSLPTQTLQILTDYDAARIGRAELEQSLDGTVAVVAPCAGRLLRVDADASRQVRPGEPLFTLEADGAALAVELRLVDERFEPPGRAVAMLDDGRRLPLTRIARGYDAATRAEVATYALATPGAAGLIVNQRLRLQAAPAP